MLASEFRLETAVRFAFNALGIGSLVSFTAVANLRSRRVMGRLGMSHDEADDFDHPKIALEHPLRPHVLYRAQAGVCSEGGAACDFPAG